MILIPVFTQSPRPLETLIRGQTTPTSGLKISYELFSLGVKENLKVEGTERKYENLTFVA